MFAKFNGIQEDNAHLLADADDDYNQALIERSTVLAGS